MSLGALVSLGDEVLRREKRTQRGGELVQKPTNTLITLCCLGFVQGARLISGM